jgi:proteasome activator subunit 4
MHTLLHDEDDENIKETCGDAAAATTKESVYVRETAIAWLLCCEKYGEITDFEKLMEKLFPILFSSQHHSDLELAVFSKNATNDLGLWLRLYQFRRPQAELNQQNPLKPLLTILENFAKSSSWKKRGAVLRFLTTFAFYHWFFMSKESKERMKNVVMEMLTDEQREVQEMAKYTLRGFLHNENEQTLAEMSQQFVELAKKSRLLYPKLVRRLKHPDFVSDASKLEETKAKMKTLEQKMVKGLLGMASLILAFPYSVPSGADVPALVEEMSHFLYLKQTSATFSYLEKIAKDTLLEFKRTHQDNWTETKAHFTREQLEAIEDLLVSPSYYT